MNLLAVSRRFFTLPGMDRVRSMLWQQPLTLLMGFAWTGLMLDRFTAAPTWLWTTVLLISAFGVLAERWLPWFKRGNLRVVLLCLAVMCLFALRHHGSVAEYRGATVLDLLSEPPQPMIAIGTLDRPARLQRDPIGGAGGWDDGVPGANGNPDAESYRTLLQVQIETFRIGLEPQAFSGRAMVRVDGDCSELLPGDRVRLLGKISLIPGPTNPGERDLRQWAARSNLHCTMQINRAENVQVIAPGADHGFSLWQQAQRMVARLAGSARRSVLSQIAPQQQGLALALVLGQRDLLDRSTGESLLVTGTAHLLSVSGLHLGILLVLARLVSGLLRLPLRAQLVFLTLVTLFYVGITGGRPPVLRAAILLATLVLATAMARPHHPINSLSFAGILLAWWMPMAIFSVGMQLSFLAVATLLTCGRVMSRGQTAASQAVELEDQFDHLARQSHGRWRQRFDFLSRAVGTALWYSLCVSVLTLPIIWHQFHVVSPISVLVNVVLSPMMVVALSAGVGTVFLGWVLQPLAIVPGWVCSRMLSVMREVIDVAAAVPGGHVWLPSPSVPWILAYYAGVLGILLIRDRGRRRLPVAAWSMLWFALACSAASTPSALPAGTYEATFVDVGHGTATVLRGTRDETWLYDCGWMGNFNHSSRKIEDTLWSMGVTKIQGIVLSHADADHFNALPGLAKRFSIGVIITPPGMLQGEGRMLGQARRVIQDYRIPVIEVDRQQGLAPLDDLDGRKTWLRDVHVLHPPSVLLDASDNANSVVLRIDHGDRSLLLPGDLEPPGTSVLISTPRPRAGGVMMAPHHGSLYMDAAAVLQWARPRETVVSGGRRAAQPAVAEMLSAAGGGVHVTAQDGALRVRIDAEGQIEIRSWKNHPW